MMHASPPPKSAWVAPSPTPTPPLLADIEIISNQIAYHVPVTGVPCAANTMFVTRIVRRPSQRMTVVVSCDGAGSALEVNDDAAARKK